MAGQKIHSAKKKKIYHEQCCPYRACNPGGDLGIPGHLGRAYQLPCGAGLLCVNLPAPVPYAGQLYPAVYGYVDPELSADVFNTLFIAIFSCILSTFYVLSASYCLSRLRFKMRKPYMNMAMILGLFPGFMSMVAVYFILKALGLSEGNLIKLALILVYSGGAALGFQIAKGFFDTIPFAVDEAAILDGCTRWQIFTKITLPLSKPIVVYTTLTAFMGPWVDFIFAKVICRANSDQYTIAIGLWRMLEKEYIDSWYTCFAAGAVLISIPIAALFLYMQRYYVDGLRSGKGLEQNI